MLLQVQTWFKEMIILVRDDTRCDVNLTSTGLWTKIPSCFWTCLAGARMTLQFSCNFERISQVLPLRYGREPQPPQWQRQEVMRWIILYSIWELQYWLLSLEVDIGGANRELACEQQPHSTIGTLHFWQNQTQVKCSTEIIVIANWGFHHSVCSVYTGSLTSRFSK